LEHIKALEEVQADESQCW